jgi:hypothetical protein
MKTFHYFTSLLVGVTFALFLTGCDNHSGHGHDHAEGAHEHGEEAHGATAGITYSEKDGLHISPETAKFIGLETAEVGERKIAGELRFSARIYRAASEARFASVQPMAAATALASGFISSAEATKLQVGQVINVTAEGEGNFSARVTAVIADQFAGQSEVLLAITDKEGKLTSGKFVAATVPFGGEATVVSVPRGALLRTTDGDFVYTMNGDAFVRAAVKLGAVNTEFAEITDGLYSGDHIIVKPAMTFWLAEIQALRGGQSCGHHH